MGNVPYTLLWTNRPSSVDNTQASTRLLLQFLITMPRANSHSVHIHYTETVDAVSAEHCLA